MIRSLKKIWRIVFNDSYEYIEWYFENIYPKNNVLVELERDEIIGNIHVNRYSFMINKRFEGNFLVGIAVLPEYQGQRVMEKMMLKLLRESYEKGDEAIFLTPIDSKIYSKYGFSYISSLYSYKCEFSHFANLKREYTVKRIENSFLNTQFYEKISKFYGERMRSFFLKVERDVRRYEELISELRCENGEIYVAYNETMDIKGYMFLLKKEEDIQVKEILVSDEKSLNSLLTILYSFKNYYRKACIITPKNLDLERYLSSDFGILKVVINKLQARILKAEKVLERLSESLSENETLVVRVLDEIILENNGVFQITQNGVKYTKEYDEIDISLDIKELSTLAYGFRDINGLLLDKKAITGKNEIVKKLFKREYNYFNQDF